MNYYIDFDHTLFNTPKLTERMLKAIVDTSKMDIMLECKVMFNREHIYNIYELAEYIANKYTLDTSSLIFAINAQIYNCSDLVFEDALSFILKLKENGHKVYMLSYYEYGLQYQIAKIAGSSLCDLFDGIIITKELKFNLDIDYTNGIFIDDKPDDLIGLYSKNAKKIIRLKRKNHKYSMAKLNIAIEEYESFDQIPLNLED